MNCSPMIGPSGLACTYSSACCRSPASLAVDLEDRRPVVGHQEPGLRQFQPAEFAARNVRFDRCVVKCRRARRIGERREPRVVVERHVRRVGRRGEVTFAVAERKLPHRPAITQAAVRRRTADESAIEPRDRALAQTTDGHDMRHQRDVDLGHFGGQRQDRRDAGLFEAELGVHLRTALAVQDLRALDARNPDGTFATPAAIRRDALEREGLPEHPRPLEHRLVRAQLQLAPLVVAIELERDTRQTREAADGLDADADKVRLHRERRQDACPLALHVGSQRLHSSARRQPGKTIECRAAQMRAPAARSRSGRARRRSARARSASPASRSSVPRPASRPPRAACRTARAGLESGRPRPRLRDAGAHRLRGRRSEPLPATAAARARPSPWSPSGISPGCPARVRAADR